MAVPAPTEPPALRWGVLGAARIAREQVIPALRRAGAGEVLAVSSASGRAEAYAAELQIPRHYPSHEELLADPDVEAVYIALPNALHASWIVSAVQAGKHVLCEKPLVMSVDELQQVEDAARAGGVHVAEGFMYRHHAQLDVVQAALRDGALGELVAVHARLHFSLERVGEADIRLRPDLGGGALRDLGCYPLDLFGRLLGAEPDDVAAVAVREGAEGVDTRLAASLRYGSVVAGLDCSFDAPMQNTACLIGTQGTLTLSEVFRADLREGSARVILQTPAGRRDLSATSDQYARQLRAFADRVRTGEPDTAGWRDTVRTTRTLVRVARAAGLPTH